MKILFLAMEAFGGFGGIAQYNRDLLKALAGAPEVSHVVALPRWLPSAPGPLPANLTYITTGSANKVSYIKAVIRLLRKNSDFDLICCGHIKLLPIAFLARLITRVPLLLLIYGIDVWNPVQDRITWWLLSKIDYIISISDITKQKFVGWSHLTRTKFFILPNAVTQKDYGAGPKRGELLERYGFGGKTVLMTLGRLAAAEKYKGFDEVMDVLSALAKDIPNIAYMIVGDGDDRARLEAKAKSLGVADRVVFTGFISEAEKADHYRLADAFVMPGRGEGFGFVFLEAMACGIPVVGSRLDGSREALRQGALGILVDPDRPAEVQAGILEALQRPRGVVPPGLDYFSFENFAERCRQILQQVI